MKTKQLLTKGAAAVMMAGAMGVVLAPSAGAAQRLKVGGSEAAGFFKEATGFDSESEVSP